MIRKFWTRLFFLIKSTNQHGVHSPFVYDLVTKGLYKKVTKNNNLVYPENALQWSKKQKNILLKLITYFSIDAILTLKNNKSNSLYNSHNNLIIIDLINLETKYLTNTNSSQILVFRNIYQTKKTYENWKKIIEFKELTVTIDLYFLGLAFKRPKQQKEHFIIRV